MAAEWAQAPICPVELDHESLSLCQQMSITLVYISHGRKCGFVATGLVPLEQTADTGVCFLI